MPKEIQQLESQKKEAKIISNFAETILSPDTPTWMKKYGLDILKKTEKGKISTSLLEKTQKGLTTKNYKNPDFQLFIKSLAQCDFSKLTEKGEGFFMLIDTIIGKKKGSAAQIKRAQEKLFKYSTRAKNNAISDAELEETFNYVKGSSREILRSTNRNSRATKEAASEVLKHTKTPTMAKVKPLAFPEETSRLIDSLTRQQADLMGDLAQLYTALKAKDTPRTKSTKLAANQTRENIITEINKKESKLNEILKELKKPKEAQKKYLEQMSRAYDEIEEISRQLGFDINEDRKIITSKGDTIEIKAIEVREEGVYIQFKTNNESKTWTFYKKHFIEKIESEEGIPEVESIEDLNHIIKNARTNQNLTIEDVFFSNTGIIIVKDINTEKSEIKIQGGENISYGEFAKRINSGNYKKEIKDPEEVKDTLAETLQLPITADGNTTAYMLQGQYVIQGKLRLNPKTGNYFFTREQFNPTNQNRLRAAGVPERYLSKRQAPFYRTGNPKKIKIPDIELTAWDLIKMARNGQIIQQPSKFPEAEDIPDDPFEIILNRPQELNLEVADGQADPPPESTDGDENSTETPENNTDNSNEENANDSETPAGQEGTSEESSENTENTSEEDDEGVENNEESEEDKKKKSGRFMDPLKENEVKNIAITDTKKDTYLKTLWKDTSFFSFSDFWEMGKKMWEYYDRRFEVKQKRKYSSVGEDLPYFGAEMQRLNTSAENDEVGEFQSSLDSQDSWSVQDRLRNTSNEYEMKAAFTSLTGKGYMIWDDPLMWDNLNQFVENGKRIPIPEDGDPYTIVDAMGRTGADYLNEAINSVWGPGTYEDWDSANKGSIKSGISKFEEEGKALATKEGGHKARLALLLGQHMSGDSIDPLRFTGLIVNMINDGKGGMDDKMYYIIAGLGAKNENGDTILQLSHLSAISDLCLGSFPHLDYFTENITRPDGSASKLTMKDYHHWYEVFEEGNRSGGNKAYMPTDTVQKFLWRNVITSEEMATRTSKLLRTIDKLDHDDMQSVIPLLSYSQIVEVSGAQTGSGRKYLTKEGYQNVFPGFGELFKSLSRNNDSSNLTEAIRK